MGVSDFRSVDRPENIEGFGYDKAFLNEAGIILRDEYLWYNAISDGPSGPPELKPPPNGATRCVEATDYMRASHMELLDEWRDLVVRENQRSFTSTLTGATYEMSLSGTCMDCHSNKAEFCDSCHEYMAVDPYCWDCHVEPEEAR